VHASVGSGLAQYVVESGTGPTLHAQLVSCMGWSGGIPTCRNVDQHLPALEGLLGLRRSKTSCSATSMVLPTVI